MARQTSGSIFEKTSTPGRWYAKFTTTRGRQTFALLTCRTREQADERRKFIAEQLAKLVAAGRTDFAAKLFELAGKAADVKELDRIARGVQAIAEGRFEEPKVAEPALDEGPTFKEFAETWTSGELHRKHPDHVKRKDSVDDDVYRLQSHVFPIIGDVPLRRFTFDHAEIAMRSLPRELSAGSRRQIAQLISRVLRLAVYPGRIIERSPIPKGFLPKPQNNRAQAWLYPEEERRLLGTSSIPVLHRLLYGVLAREGMRTSEACLLTWGDLDLERGTITLDENKTDDPRAWVLDDGVLRALRKWKELHHENAKPSSKVFSHDGQAVDVAHLANTFRSHLTRVEGIRPVLFERSATRCAIRAHDLRATFVTLALATGRSETWVADRTGHRSSAMINRYRRAARSAADLNLGWLPPLDEALTDLMIAPSTPMVSHELRSICMPNLPDARSAASETRDRRSSRRSLVSSLTIVLPELVARRDTAAAAIVLRALQALVDLELAPAGDSSKNGGEIAQNADRERISREENSR